MTRKFIHAAFALLLSTLALLPVPQTHAQNATITIRVDASRARHPISPYIYGVALGTKDQIAAMGATVNRLGGNNTSSYNWKVNSSNNASDWFFETPPGQNWLAPPGQNLTPAARPDQFYSDTSAAGAKTMLTVLMLGWVGKVVDPNTLLYSYSVAEYGPQQKTDPQHPDAGNGKRPDGTRITDNDPNDANVPSDVDFQRGFVEHLVKRWGKAAHGGVEFYLMDNEPGLWQETHQDVHPNGATSKEIADDIIAYASMVKSIDPSAQIVAPEEWSYMAIADSGADKQYGEAHGWPAMTPDRAARGGMDNMPWILDYIHKHDLKTGHRTLDYFTIHLYPQAGEGGDDVTRSIELKRNESTRQLWDPNYVDGSWIKDKIMMIPRLKAMVDQYYPGTKIGITEYNWGAEGNINGATAQADILGIFGREGLDLGTRWIAPATGSPTFKAFQMYRNYDGAHSAFGSISVSDIPDCDCNQLSSFAALRASDHALTVIVINKDLDNATPLALHLAGFDAGASAQLWQLTSANQITRLADSPVVSGTVDVTVPAQSVTLFVVPRR